MATRNASKYTGTIEIGGFTLLTRIRDYLGEPYVVPEHIVPVVQKNKHGDVIHSCWQVRISKPYRAFRELDDAIDYLAQEIKSAPPKREAKYAHDEFRSKKYVTGLPGLGFQKQNRVGGDLLQEIKLNLTFKRHNVHLYIGTPSTSTRERFKDCFVHLYVLRKWLEKLSRERDFDWMNDKKVIPDSIYDEIPKAFKEREEERALSEILYDGFDAFMSSIREELEEKQKEALKALSSTGIGATRMKLIRQLIQATDQEVEKIKADLEERKLGKFLFKVGDRVNWTSQAGGSAKTKRGNVVFVYKPGESELQKKIGSIGPREYARQNFPEHKLMFDGNRWPLQSKEGGRPTVFVSVEDGGKSGRAAPKLYMPKIGLVKKVD